MVAEAAQQVGSETLNEAVGELKRSPEGFATMLQSSSAVVLIEKISEGSRKQFRELMTQLQQATDPAEIESLKRRVDKVIFGR